MLHSFCIICEDQTIKNEFIQNKLTALEISTIDRMIMDSDPIGIAEIRKLKLWAGQKPFNSKHKVISIWSDFLTPEAQQALLKLLEEPPEHTFIYLLSSNESILLPTVLSRCEIVYLSNIKSGTVQLDPKIEEFWEKILSQNIGERLREITSLVSEREDARIWLKENLIFWRQKLLQRATDNKNNELSSLHVVKILRLLQKTYNQIETNISLKLAIDHLFINLPFQKKITKINL